MGDCRYCGDEESKCRRDGCSVCCSCGRRLGAIEDYTITRTYKYDCNVRITKEMLRDSKTDILQWVIEDAWKRVDAYYAAGGAAASQWGTVSGGGATSATDLEEIEEALTVHGCR